MAATALLFYGLAPNRRAVALEAALSLSGANPGAFKARLFTFERHGPVARLATKGGFVCDIVPNLSGCICCWDFSDLGERIRALQGDAVRHLALVDLPIVDARLVRDLADRLQAQRVATIHVRHPKEEEDAQPEFRATLTLTDLTQAETALATLGLS
ncbi:hypothetical protein [Nibricoccus sp. IMCC34717]|uniref:hypothetical protein n=1 Tax=Nibricoccus sp. IMCC34717 TaxID=3034021 RepID=UPI00384DA2C8